MPDWVLHIHLYIYISGVDIDISEKGRVDLVAQESRHVPSHHDPIFELLGHTSGPDRRRHLGLAAMAFEGRLKYYYSQVATN